MRIVLIFFLLGLIVCSCDVLQSQQPATNTSANAELEQQRLQLQQLQQKNNHLADSISRLQNQVAFLENVRSQGLPIFVGGSDSILLERDSMRKVFIQQIFTASPTPQYPLRINLFDNSFDAMIVKLKKSDIQFFWSYPKTLTPYRSFLNVKKAVKQTLKKDLVFATNAGMFTPKSAPKGLYIENGIVIQPIDTISGRVSNFNFYLQPNGIFYITKDDIARVVTTKEYLLFPPKAVKYATQSGPMLVIDNQIHPAFRQGSVNKYIRSGVGIIDSDHIVFIISNKPVNFFDFASLFRDYFGCKNALYLDGAISEMYLPELKRDYLSGNFGPIIGIIE